MYTAINIDLSIYLQCFPPYFNVLDYYGVYRYNGVILQSYENIFSHVFIFPRSSLSDALVIVLCTSSTMQRCQIEFRLLCEPAALI